MEHNNQITLTQWNELIKTVIKHTNHDVDSLYMGFKENGNSTRFWCYDDHDNINTPGLDFVTLNQSPEIGNLTVYNTSEQARAPITFEQGKTIARFFWDDNGSQMSEEIVCDWIMDGNKSAF